MKKILLFLSLFIAIKTMGQTIPPPVSPQAVTQMSWFREPSTNKMFANRGATLGWWQPADSLQVIRLIQNAMPATLTFGNGITKTINAVGLGSADGSNGLNRVTFIAQNGFPFYIAEQSLIPNGGQQFALGSKSFGLVSAEDTLFSTVGAGTAAISAKGVQISANKFNPATGQVLAKQVLSITGSSMVILDQIRNKGLEAGGNYEGNYTSKSYTSKRWGDSVNNNNIHSIGFSNQLINDGLQLNNTIGDPYTLAIDGKGIRNSDYQITTNGSNAFFNVNIRNGLGIVGKSGNSIASFNDQNGTADNPNISLYFPVTGVKYYTTESTSGAGDYISIFTNNIRRATTSQGFSFADINNTNYTSIQHNFKDLTGNEYLTLGNGSDGPLSEAVHLRVTNAPTNALDVVRLQDITNLNSSYNAASTAVSGINIHGTSYEGPGFGASNPSTLSWVPLVKQATGWTINNQAVSGNFVCDQALLIYNTTFYPRTFTIADLGVNDMNFYYTDATKQAIFANEHLAVMAYMAIPNSKKILANSSAVTYAGTWTSGKYAISKQTSGSGNTATMTITGTTVIVSTTQGDGLTGGFTIKIDGSTAYTGTNGTAASMVTNNGSGINYGPSIKILTGLSNTPHTVVITTTNANAVYFDWAAGIDTSTPNPTVYAFNLVYQNATGNPYPINNPNVDTYNGFITSNISTLSGLGLNIGIVDINSVINPATDIGAFGIHPNDAGYAKIATKVLATIPSTFYNVGSPIQTLSSANNAASWLVLKNTNPALTSGVGIRLENDDASNASIFRAPSTATDRTPFALYITNNSTSNNTVNTNDVVIMNGAVEALRLLSGGVRFTQYKTSGVLTNAANTGQVVSSPTLSSALGGTGFTNSGTFNWGAINVLGDIASLSKTNTTLLGTLSVPTGNFSGTQVGMFTAWPVNTLALFGASSSGGAGYPFNGNNNALIAARPAFDIVLGTGNPTVTRGYVSALSGNLNWGATSGTDIGALFSVVQPSTGNGTVTNIVGGTTLTGVNTQFNNTFQVGDAITIAGETQTISAIASNTSMTTSAWTNAHTTAAYTLVGGTRVQAFGNGKFNISGLTASQSVQTDVNKNLISVANTGTGSNVLATSPTLVTPALGTPSALVLTNATGLPTAGLVNNAVTYTKMQAMTTSKLLGSGSGTAVAEITLGTGLSFSGSTLNVATINRGHTIFTPTTGGTVVLLNNQWNIINPAGTLATLTVTLPSSPANNDFVNIKYTQAVTAVTYNGGTVVDGITSPIAGGLVILTYDSGTTSWY